MAADFRPGGLTALAVLNFVYAGFNGLALLSYGVVGLLFNVMASNNHPNKDAPVLTASDVHQATNAIVLGAAAALICTVLLIMSGVGMLKQKRVLGRYVGSAYAFVSVLYHVYSLYGMHAQQSQQGGPTNHAAGIVAIIFFIYPLVLLLLINTTFRDDLVN